jgi:curved DNA-binding protein CbpA
VAGDEDYLLLCSRIVDGSAKDARALHHLTDICRKHGLDSQVLKEKLTPVALALGLTGSSENQNDYYELLGIPLDADVADIKKAFRKRVRNVHPDTSGEVTDSGHEFIHLKAAYQILSDPILRQQYDETLQHVNLWKEEGDPISKLRGLNPLTAQNTNPKRSGRTRIFYQLGILFLLMIIAVFILDFLYRQNSVFEGDPGVNQKQVTEPKRPKEGSQKQSKSIGADKIRLRKELKILGKANYPQITQIPQINFKSKEKICENLRNLRIFLDSMKFEHHGGDSWFGIKERLFRYMIYYNIKILFILRFTR